MEFAPIKLQEFAKQNGVTDRAIQRHIKKHEKELQGHVIRKGPNGTWMDEFAQMYVKNLLREHPIVVSEVSEQVSNLEAENKMLLMALNDAKDMVIALKDEKTELLLQVSSMARLEVDNEVAKQRTAEVVAAAEKEKALLEGFIANAKAEIAALSDEKAEAEAKTREAAEAVQKAQDELTAALEREQQVKEYYKALAAWEALPKRKRRNTKKNREKNPKPVAPEWLQAAE